MRTDSQADKVSDGTDIQKVINEEGSSDNEDNYLRNLSTPQSQTTEQKDAVKKLRPKSTKAKNTTSRLTAKLE